MVATSQPSMTPAQQNALAESLIFANSVDRIQKVYSANVDASDVNGVFNITPRNVGLLRGFIVKVTAAFSNTGATAATLTPLGASNLLSNISFTDLQNNTRINTTGWHLHAINTARGMRPFGIPFAMAATPPVAYGNNFGEISAPATIPETTGAGTVQMMYYVPVAYSHKDLRGAIYAGVVNASMNLSLQLNQAAMTAAADATQSVYAGVAPPANTFGGIGNVQVEVYQHYFDQLPTTQSGPVLPLVDLSTSYELKNVGVQGMTANIDFPVPYSNFRTFMSTFALFDNGGKLNAGSDVAYFGLQSANYTNLWKMGPQEIALLSLAANGVDYPDGLYYFSHRNRPINTSQFGNMELILNASTVEAGAQLLVGYEDFAVLNTLNNAGSLPGG